MYVLLGSLDIVLISVVCIAVQVVKPDNLSVVDRTAKRQTPNVKIVQSSYVKMSSSYRQSGLVSVLGSSDNDRK